MARSNNGKLIATGGTEGILRVWSYSSGALLSEHVGHSATINCVQFSSDDRQLVSVSDDGCAFVWSIFES